MKHELKSCEVCGKVIPKERNRNWNQYAQKRFCCRACSAEWQSQKLALTCEYCQEAIERSPALVRGSAYCSRKCRSLANTIPYTCPICNKDGRKPKSQIIKDQQKIYCSRECANKGLRVEKPVLTCDFCGDEFERYPSEITKAKDRGYSFVFCSHACRAAMIAVQFNPPKPYAGRHTTKPRNGTQTLKWRKAVKERDNYTCQDCGSTDKMLNAHHIKPFALYPDLAYDVGNGVTLCYECHEKRHSLQITSV